MAEESRSWAKNLKKCHKEIDTGEYWLPIVSLTCSTWGAYGDDVLSSLKIKLGGWCPGVSLFLQLVSW